MTKTMKSETQAHEGLPAGACSVVEIAATCQWCKKPFTDLHVVGSKREPHPMCDECLEFADEEFRPQNAEAIHGEKGATL